MIDCNLQGVEWVWALTWRGGEVRFALSSDHRCTLAYYLWNRGIPTIIPLLLYTVLWLI